MRRYQGPRDRLDAASSADTPPAELAVLTSSEHAFVRAALARNPKTPPDALRFLLRDALEREQEQEVAEALAARGDAPPELLTLLADALATHLHAGRDSHTAFGAAVALCCNPATPFAAVQMLLTSTMSKPTFRKVVARESRRADVLALLAHDVSSRVADRARKSIGDIGAWHDA